MRLAVRLGLVVIVANVAMWLLLGGDSALSLMVGLELVLLLVVRHFTTGYGAPQLEARVQLMIFVAALLFVVVLALRIQQLLSA